jgi:hypothetical protein
MSVLSNLVAKFRKGSPNIAAAFDEVERRLVALETTTEPPPPPPPPTGTWPPAGCYRELTLDFESPPGSNWHDEHQPPGTELFHQAADPRGGANKVLKAYTGPNADSPATSQSSNADFYIYNGQAYAGQGQHTWYRGDLLLLEGHYQPTRGSWNWLMNWHISNAISTSAGAASCTMGIHTDNTGTDANPTFWLQYQGGNPASPLHADADLLPFTYGLHSFMFEYYWSVNSDGYCNAFHNGTFLRKFSGPNLYKRPDGSGDIPAWGLYNYHIKVGRAMTTYWDRCAAGPTRASVGG